MEKISFLGCGSWGGALGSILAEKNFEVTMWHRNDAVIRSLNETRVHYLIPELKFPKIVNPKIGATRSLSICPWKPEISMKI